VKVLIRIHSATGYCSILILTLYASEIFYFLIYVVYMRHIPWNISYKCPWQIIFCLNVFEANVYIYNYGYGKLCRARMRLQQIILFMNVDTTNHVVYECHYRKCWFSNVAVEDNYFCMNTVTTTVFIHKCGHGK
jgi:hypothetical protein